MPPPDRTRPQEKPRSRRHAPEEARGEIARAAVRFLSSRPFRDLTVKELMEATELSRPAFYQYFRDLHELMESLLAGLAKRVGDVANPWLAGVGDPHAALYESLRGVVQVGFEDGPILRAIAEATAYDVRLERAWADFMARWDEAVCARIEAQQAQGLVPPLDARALANALNALDAALLIQAFGHPGQGDPQAVLDTLHRVWTGALYAPPSHGSAT